MTAVLAVQDKLFSGFGELACSIGLTGSHSIISHNDFYHITTHDHANRMSAFSAVIGMHGISVRMAEIGSGAQELS